MRVLLRSYRNSDRIISICKIQSNLSLSASACGFKNRKQWLGTSIGRMLDLGGMPSASNDSSKLRTVNASKNSRLQAVAFDFDLLTGALSESSSTVQTALTSTSEAASKNVTLGDVQPDANKLQQVASLLNVTLGGSDDDKDKTLITLSKKEEDDLRQLEGTRSTPPSSPRSQSSKKKDFTGGDIRAKYASKIKGGLAGVELAKSRVDETLKGGDAAGHWAARKVVAETPSSQQATKSSQSNTRWMAMTGTGKLLSYLTHRSIKIALLPKPGYVDASELEQEQIRMKDFAKQLPQVEVDAMVDGGIDRINQNNNDGVDAATIMKRILQQVRTGLDLDPRFVLLVSDRDDYLMAARDEGMITCRIQPKNARRGKITCHYTTTTVPDVQDIVNEINGISFSAVLNR